MSRIHKAKVTQSLIQCGFQLLKALSPGQYEIIWTRLCQSGPQLFFETQGADTTQPWAERHTEREREKEREKERDLARSATMAACRGSEQRRAVISVLLFRQESPFPLGSHKKQADSCCTHKGPDGPQLTLMWNYCLVNPPLNKINGAVRLQYHFVYLIRLLFHLASVPVLLAFAPSFWKLDKPLNLWTSPILGNLHTGITSHGALWFFIKMLENCVTGVKKNKKKNSSSHQEIDVWTVPCCRTPTTQLYLAVMYHWCESMASGSITRISAPLSLTSGSRGAPRRPPASEKHSQHADETHQSLWECATNVLFFEEPAKENTP